MIEQLTPEQTARFPEFINKWTKIGLSTEPADRPRAEVAIRLMYEAGGLPPPKKIVWFNSPQAMFTEYRRLGYPNSVGSAIDDVVGSAVMSTVIGTVCDAVQCTVGYAVRDAVGYAVWSAVKGAVCDTVRYAVYGFHEACWLAQYDFYREVLGLIKETDRLAGMFELAKSCGWIIPCKKICFASERHNVLNFDNKGKVHCENGPAVSYPDGWSVYADHGVTVPEKVVMDLGRFTLKELKKLKMPEVKVVLRKIGMEKFMAIPGTTPDTWMDLFNEIAKETVND